MKPLYLPFFLRNWHKSLVRVYNNMVDINNIFHKIFVLCNLDLWFKSYIKVLWNPSKSVWSGHEGTCLGGWSATDHILSSWKIIILQIKHFYTAWYKGWGKIQYCYLIEWWWANIRHELLHLAVIIGSACRVWHMKSIVHLCFSTSWSSTMSQLLLLSGVLHCVECRKCNLNWLIVSVKLALPK